MFNNQWLSPLQSQNGNFSIIKESFKKSLHRLLELPQYPKGIHVYLKRIFFVLPNINCMSAQDNNSEHILALFLMFSNNFPHHSGLHI